MEEIKKTLSTLKQWYGIFWIIPIIIVLMRELSEDGTGYLASNASVVYAMETATILLTCLNVPLALKPFSLVLKKKVYNLELKDALKLSRSGALSVCCYCLSPFI